jgi:hypothetical protein
MLSAYLSILPLAFLQLTSVLNSRPFRVLNPSPSRTIVEWSRSSNATTRLQLTYKFTKSATNPSKLRLYTPRNYHGVGKRGFLDSGMRSDGMWVRLGRFPAI